MTSAAAPPVTNREQERRRSAALRAIAAEPEAEFRANRLTVASKRVQISSPYLTAPASQRGVGDALAMLLRMSDHQLHLELRPPHPLERVIFDFAEQLRCESLVPESLPGVRTNIDRAFRGWCRSVHAQRIGENGLGLLVYTVTHMMRARLVEVIFDEEIDALTEITRGNLGALVGHALRDLRALRSDQESFAAAALEIARLVVEMAGDAADASGTADDARSRLLILGEWEDAALDGEVVGEGSHHHRSESSDTDLDSLGGYNVFTRAHDREILAVDLYAPAALHALRQTLDEQVRAQSVSPFRLARRLQTLLATPQEHGWEDNHEIGVLDVRRLAQMIAMPANPNTHRQRAHQPEGDAAVTFLVDTSGSMKAQRYETVAVLLDTFARALDLAGVAVEVLGFTTGSWAGGASAADWRRAGRPPGPGRIADLLHIVYKEADQPWRRARRSLAAMLRTTHYREGVDGEALAWAYRRLIGRSERRRILIVVSDGAPMEAATAAANGESFLPGHLADVAAVIERDPRVELRAVAIDLDVAACFSDRLHLDLSGVLDLGMYTAMETLIGRA